MFYDDRCDQDVAPVRCVTRRVSMDPNWVALQLATPQNRGLLAIVPDPAVAITRVVVAETFSGYDAIATISGSMRRWLADIEFEIEFRRWSARETELRLRPIGRNARTTSKRYFEAAHLVADWVVDVVTNPIPAEDLRVA